MKLNHVKLIQDITTSNGLVIKRGIYQAKQINSGLVKIRVNGKSVMVAKNLTKSILA